MAAPDPAAVERQMYLTILGIDDNPLYSLANLRDMTGGGVNTHRSAIASVADMMSGQGSDPVASDGGYFDHGNQSGNVSYDALNATHVLNMTDDTNVTITGGVDGKNIIVFATGTGVLNVQGKDIPTGRAL